VHLQGLRAELRAFHATEPFQVGTKRELTSRRLTYYLTRATQPPTSVSLLAGEVLQALRSALDHLAYHLVQIGTRTPGPFKHVYFPICPDADRYQADKRKKTEGMRPDALTAIDACKPYRGGNDILWRLDRLNNVDKHRLLIAVGSAYSAVDVMPSLVRAFATPTEGAKGFSAAVELLKSMQLMVRPADRMFPLKAGDELFQDRPDAEPMPARFQFDVALHEHDVCDGIPVMSLMEETVAEVERVVAGFLPHLGE
jgi:hypothetical protein